MHEHSGYLFILFDVPSINKQDKKLYRKVVKELKARGFIMAIESNYYKYYENLNNSVYDISKIKTILNNNGKVFALKYTENDFDKIEYLAGPSLIKLNANVVTY